MDFVNERFLDSIFELILVRVAKELPVRLNKRRNFTPRWLEFDYFGLAGELRVPIRRCPFAELGGRWGKAFDLCRRHYKFISMAIWFPTAEWPSGFLVSREYTLFNRDDLHTSRRSDMPYVGLRQYKPFLLDLFCLQTTANVDDFGLERFDYGDQATLSELFAFCESFHCSSNPRIYIENFQSTAPFLSQVLRRLTVRQSNTEVFNSPDTLALLLQNQPNIVETYGKTLSVAISSLEEVFQALEIDSFSEFRFRKAREDNFSGEGFVERVKTSLKKRSSKAEIKIVIEDPSLASDLFGEARHGARESQ